jgi:signal transduction histidine kinase
VKSSRLQTGLLRWAIVAVCFGLAMVAAWSPLADRIDNYAYDYITTVSKPPSAEPESVIVGIDDETYTARGGVTETRRIVSEALDKIAPAHPKAVAIDVILHDASLLSANDLDVRLEASLRATHNPILAADIAGGKWEEPLERFRTLAAAVGHVERDTDPHDGVLRRIRLERVAGGEQHWALALEAFRVSRGLPIVGSEEDLEIGGERIPAPLNEEGRILWIRYLASGIPTVSVLAVEQHPEMIRGKVVFLGATAQSATKDRLLDPYGQNVPGVEVNAHVFETLARGDFLVPAREFSILMVCVGFAIAAGLSFQFLPGWWAYAAILPVLALALRLPFAMYGRGIVFPLFAPAAVAWMCPVGAGLFQHFFVRRQLRDTESERSRYQQAIHWAAHEMRTPLTAIQGSSEIMTRYTLPEAKRAQLSEMINSESKRLSRIIQTFLDVERLADGHVEMKREVFAAAPMVDTCLKRVAPLAERKQIAITLDRHVEADLVGDRELMEYAFYNLLNNAVKYSPAETHVRVFSDLTGAELRLAVRDEGIGMDAKDLRNIFKKFYRSRRAENSGEVGTGIGLSIVEQIVGLHGGRIEVTSKPGKGSCFTIVMKARAAATPGNATEALDR